MDFTFDFLRIFAEFILRGSPIIVFLLSLVVLMGQVVGRKEGWTRFDALYFSLITATTVGYGDLHPRKRSSKALAVAIALVGLLVTGMIVAIGVHAASEAVKQAPTITTGG